MGCEFQVSAPSAGSRFSFGELEEGPATAVLADGRIVSVWMQDFGNGELYSRTFKVPMPANGLEGQPLALKLSASLSDTDGSEAPTITLSGFPTGTTFDLGQAGASGSGTWVIENAQSVDLSTLTMRAPPSWNGDFTRTATATATETATGATAQTMTSLNLSIAAVHSV